MHLESSKRSVPIPPMPEPWVRSRAGRDWPKTPSWLARRLNESALNLRALGVHVEPLPRSRGDSHLR